MAKHPGLVTRRTLSFGTATPGHDLGLSGSRISARRTATPLRRLLMIGAALSVAGLTFMAGPPAAGAMEGALSSPTARLIEHGLDPATPEQARLELRDLSVDPGNRDAAPLVAWAEDRRSCWAGGGHAAKECRLDVNAALERLRATAGPESLGDGQLVMVFFEPGDSGLGDPTARSLVSSVAHTLRSGNLRVRVIGYADPGELSGNTPQAVDLAMERARAVAWSLQQEGVSAGDVILSARVSVAPPTQAGSDAEDALAATRERRVEMIIEDAAVANGPSSDETVVGATLMAKGD
ncbi:hypothetical protein CKO38_16130 [Rhodospirillum rubrum]|uniref:OmpA family protein n=1 Tax=Rhodospirillum rubrum TaxID=1085 RepID=UPI001ECCD5A4|nr:OmpA family protein [Rhodospirillum rubrum]MBK1666051.1 hypothetical protein [Rhodospirillum rubrum]MBK1678172.1 hypothetical protein [Rhodospirillum rubrum]